MNYVAVRAVLFPYANDRWSLQVAVSFSCPYCRQITCEVRKTDRFVSSTDVFTAVGDDMTGLERILTDFQSEVGCHICHIPSEFRQDDRMRFELELMGIVTPERIARGMAKRAVSSL